MAILVRIILIVRNIVKKIHIAALFISALAGTSIAYAGNTAPMASGPFNISGGSVNSKQELSVSFASLPDGGHGALYDITCYVENTNYSKLYPVVLQVMVLGGNYPRATVNGQTGFQFKLDRLTNVVEVKNMSVFHGDTTGEALIKFNNLDDTDSVYVRYCAAVYSNG